MEAVAAPRALRGPTRRIRATSDEQLIARVRDGDESAFEALYERYHLQLLAFCRHMLGTREEAEDTLQHVFIAAYRQITGEDRALQLKPWLYRVARNRCLSVLRARHDAIAFDESDLPSSDGLAVADEVERRQELKEMLGDLARLPDEQRAALVLAEIGALSHDEIAEALEVRKDKVKALVFQARESLMSKRHARGTDCRVIQEQLATARGSALRRAQLRHHVEVCGACAGFEIEVQRQRAALVAILPVVPTLALKHGILASVAAAAGHATAAGGVVGAGVSAATGAGVAAGGAAVVAPGAVGGLTSAGTSAIAAKVLVAAALAGGVGTGGVTAIRQLDRPSAPPTVTTVRTPTTAVVSPAASHTATSHAQVPQLARGQRSAKPAAAASPHDPERAKPGVGNQSSRPGNARDANRGGRPTPNPQSHATRRAAGKPRVPRSPRLSAKPLTPPPTAKDNGRASRAEATRGTKPPRSGSPPPNLPTATALKRT